MQRAAPRGRCRHTGRLGRPARRGEKRHRDDVRSVLQHPFSRASARAARRALQDLRLLEGPSDPLRRCGLARLVETARQQLCARGHDVVCRPPRSRTRPPEPSLRSCPVRLSSDDLANDWPATDGQKTDALSIPLTATQLPVSTVYSCRGLQGLGSGPVGHRAQAYGLPVGAYYSKKTCPSQAHAASADHAWNRAIAS
jgi:hypothetical protein